jgi:hypothetical protein
MELRRAGTRTSFAISYDAVYTEAAQRSADKERAERKSKGRA